MPYELVKHLRLDANHATFYVFNPESDLEAFEEIASLTDDEAALGYLAIENAIAYFIDGDPIEYDLDIYLSASPPSLAEAKRAFVHNITLDSGELAIEEAVPDETHLVQVPPNRYAMYQLTYDYEVESEVARFALYLVPGEVKTQGEMAL